MDKTTAGWNDPPMMTYQVSDSSKPRTLLNKRIAYPLTSSVNNELPKQNYSALPPTTTCQVSKIADVTEVPYKEDSLVFETVNRITGNIENDNKKPEIVKRLEIMKKMWEENELNPEIHNKIMKFFESLENNEINTANEVYMSLTINSAALCSPWIIALKYIIHYYKLKNP